MEVPEPGKRANPDQPKPGHEAYSDYIKDEYDAEADRKNSLEQRGIGVITTSGTLVTLVFALVAVVIGGEHFRLPHEAHIPLYLAIGFFIAAILTAIFTNVPRKFQRVDPNELDTVVKTSRWADSSSDAIRNVAATRLTELKSAQQRNQQTAKVLMVAMLCEVIAICSVGVAVIFTLLHPPKPH
jgi:uncharacterized membrane protein (DUF106 family)